jgi:DNA-binding Lrp family transcriptional regulator
MMKVQNIYMSCLTKAKNERGFSVLRRKVYEDGTLRPHAYLLLNIRRGYEEHLCTIIQSIPEVRDAYILCGVFDLLIDIETDDLEHLKEKIKKIRSLEYVRTIISLIVEADESA